MTKEAGDLYAKVMVDTPGLGLLDYAVPADMLVAVGDRAVSYTHLTLPTT